MITGWARHLANDIDPIAVERLLKGEPTDCTAWERRYAVRLLRERGMNKLQIARHLGIEWRQVHRDLRWAAIHEVTRTVEAERRSA